jgi:phospholipid/cholesterol/gamma-HCH transport system permease protein
MEAAFPKVECSEPALGSELLQPSEADGEMKLKASGAWTADNARELDDIAQEFAGMRSFEIDATGINALDTFGARTLHRLVRSFPKKSRDVSLLGLSHRYGDLFNRVSQASDKQRDVAVAGSSLSAGISALRQKIVCISVGFLDFLAMLGEIGNAAFRVLLNPRSFRLTSAVNQLDRVGWQAIPIILLITFLIGCIIAQQGFFHFRKFGADEYVVDMVGILILREIGVLIVAIMVAGRSGSAYTAELGSMKMREEIDALRTMGLDPVEILVLPRVVALIIALPILDFLGSMAALYGSGLTAWLYGHMSPEIFIARLKDAISITHFKVGIIKAPFMALAIGAVACAEGFAVKGSAESLGRQTTSSVVKSIFLVIVLDGLFAIFFASIGM